MPFKVETQPGRMRHTLTGLKRQFANHHIHVMFATCYVPFRSELMRRKEVGSESGMPEALRTLIFKGLRCWADNIRKYQAGEPLDANATLAQREKGEKDFLDKILSVNEDFESIARDSSATHLDRMLPPSTQRVNSVTFDFEGKRDKDMEQPTPDRVQHPILRALIVGMDTLVVEMSCSHSSDTEATIISQEAGFWLAAIADLWRMVDDYDPAAFPFWPTARSGNERDQGWNADGAADPLIGAGDTPGEKTGTDRRGSDSTGGQ